MRKQLFTLLLLVGLAVASCTAEKQNVITGKVEGLKVGDKIILEVADNGEISPDTVVVEKEGELSITTAISGDYAWLKYNNDVARIFLEGYAELQVTGNANDWSFLSITGGIYSHPDLLEIMRITDSAKSIQEEALTLRASGRETGDTVIFAEGTELIKKSKSMMDSVRLMQKEFRNKHPELAYSASLLRYDYELMRTFDKYEEAFNAFTPEVQKSLAGVRISTFIANVKASRVGAEAPDFTLATLDGQEVTLSAYRGKYVLLDFWGSWCGPCRESSPMLVELYNKLKEKAANIEFIGIACSERGDENWIKAIESDGLPWIQLNDAHSVKGKSIQATYAIDGVPTCILISPEGVIIHKEHPLALIPKVQELFDIAS